MSLNSDITLPFERSHAFIIGINDYEDVTPLRTAINDAKGIAERLETQHGYEVHGPLLNATKADLERLFHETMPDLVGEEDRVIFYFAGHGIALDGEEGPNGYLVPVDASQGDRTTLIPMDELHQTLNKLPCKHGLLILDCCFSGAFKWSSGYRDIVMEFNIIYEERFWRYTKDPAWQVITSSASDQKAADFIPGQKIGIREEGSGMHSPFASSLFRALEGEADVVPTDKQDGVITASELYTYLRDDVESTTVENVKRQSPSLFNLQKHDKGEFIFLNPKHPFNLPPTPDRNPFVGLRPYEQEDAPFFFGRDRAISALKKKVAKLPLTVVGGASGTGKSSLVRAGLIPKLHQSTWTILPVMCPGENPLANLNEAIPDLSKWTEEENQLLLFVDQYEELITLCKDNEQRNQFEQQLADWLKEYPQLHIILSIRSDYERDFEEGVLAPWWEEGYYEVPTFSQDEIRQIITNPAAQSVLFYEPIELVDRIMEDVSRAPGMLPLLSHTLSELYTAYLNSGREDRALKLEDYEKFGGVDKLICTKADEYYEKQSTQDWRRIRKLMLRMINYEEGTLTPRRVYEEELVYADAEDTKRIAILAQELVNARVLKSGLERKNGNRRFFELAHYSLIDHWSKFQVWINEVGEKKLVLHNELWKRVRSFLEMRKQTESIDQQTSKINLWTKTKTIFAEQRHRAKTNKLLWNRHLNLDILAADLTTTNHYLNAKEQKFIKRSVERRKILRRNERILAVVIMAALATAAVFSYSQKIIAEDERDRADEKARESQAAATSAKAWQMQDIDPTIALNLAYVAQKLDTSTVTAAALGDILNDKNRMYKSIFKQKHGIRNAACSPNGKYVVTAPEEGPATIWDISKGKIVMELKGHDWEVLSASFSPDGKYVLTGSYDNTAKLWDINTGNMIDSLIGHKEHINSVAFSPNGKYVATASADSTARLWNIDLGICDSLIGHKGAVYSVAFSSDGTYMATASEDGMVKLWDVSNGNFLDSLIGHDGEIYSVAFSPTGNFVATASADGTAKLWNISENKTSKTFEGHGDEVVSINFSPDGQYLATASIDRNVILWDVQTGKEIRRFNGHRYYVSSVTFTPDGLNLITTSLDSTVRIWDVNMKDEIGDFLGHNNSIFSVAFSPDGEYLLTGSADSTAKLWEVKTGKQIGDFVDSMSSVSSVVFASDKNRMLTSSNNVAKLWDTNSGKLLLQFKGHQQYIYSVAFSKNGEKILTGSSDNVAIVWSIDSGKILHKLAGHKDDIRSVAFSPNGKYAITGSQDETAILWDVHTGELIHSFTGHTASISSVDFSPDGKSVLTTSWDGTIKLWDIESCEKIRDFLINEEGVEVAIFSPDGKKILADSYLNDHVGRAQLWDIALGIPILNFIGHKDGIYAIAFSPDGKYVVTGSLDGTAKLWNTSFDWDPRVYKLNKEEREKYGITIDY